MPSFAQGNLTKNRALVEALEIMALVKNETAAQVALAWLTRQWADILPIPGMNSNHQAQRYLGVPHALSPE